MTAQAGAATGTLWEAHLPREVITLAVRSGENPAVALATDDGTCWWLDESGEALHHAATSVDVPTAVALHPLRDEVVTTGALGYAVWSPGEDPQPTRAGWCSDAVYNRFGDLAVATGRTLTILDRSGATWVSDQVPSTITGLGWSPQANRVSVSAYGGVYTFDGRRSEPVRTHPYLGSHLAVAVHPRGRWVCSGNQDASVHIWRTADNSELQMQGFPEKVTRLVFDDTGRWLANNGASDVAVWDFAGAGPGGRDAHLLPGHDRIRDLAWRPGSGAVLASVGSEGTVRVWTVSSKRSGLPQVRSFPFDDARSVRWLDSERLIIARAGGVVTALSWPST